ncbi:hypothetical protein [Putridiphycobacter roseus]|nr:hypothetical protein [Putridiphycobacter roseus]
MKKQFIYIMTVGLMAGTLLTSCGEASKNDLKDAKEDMSEVTGDLKRANKDAKLEVKNAVNAQWDTFKTQSDLAISSTEAEILVLREKIAKANDAQRKKLNAALDKLEKKNQELKAEIAERNQKIKEEAIDFDEAAKESEKEFEREFNHDMKELGTALKDLFKNNVE